jgi:hypothetical protein
MFLEEDESDGDGDDEIKKDAIEEREIINEDEGNRRKMR